MKNELTALIAAIAADYDQWTSRGDFDPTGQAARVAKFTEELSVKEGKKYAKIISGGSVWGFIVIKGDDKFREGDILKAASWSAPAKNHARGNVFTGYAVQWTGPAYHASATLAASVASMQQGDMVTA